MEGLAQAPRVRHRLFALAALVAVVAAVAVLAYLLISSLVVLPFALLGLIVAVVAGWSALISRGTRRALRLAVAVLGLAGAIYLLGPSTLAGVVVVVGLAVASVAASRAAIGRHRPQAAPADPAPPTTSVAAATRPVMLVNPRSGTRSDQKSSLVRRAVRRGIACVIVREDDDLRDVAEREVARGATAIGMAGDVAFVCLPAGTRNHFAQDLGLNRRDLVGALDAFGPALERRVDLATVNGRVFVNNASMGVYAAIVQSEGYRGSKVLTAAGMLPELVGPDSTPFDLRFTGPDGESHTTTDLLLVSNNAYAVVTPVGLGSRPRLDAGELGVLSVRTQRGERTQPLPPPKLPLRHRLRLALPGRRPPQPVTSATALARGNVLAWAVPTFRVDSAETVAVGIDGEAVQLEPPLEFRTLPGALRVRVPRYVVTPAAAGRAPGVGETALALLRILSGRPAWVDQPSDPA